MRPSPCFVASMDGHSRKAWTKTDGEDAARLLAEMVQRTKRPAGEMPAEIQNPADVPRKLGHGASEESALGFGAHHPRKLPEEKQTETDGGKSASVLSATGEVVGRRWGVANNDNQFGLLDSSMKAARSPSNPSGTPVTSLRAFVHPQR
jgi:hypothetical protein